MQALGIPPLAVRGNGSLIHDFAGEQVVDRQPTAYADARTALKALHDEFPTVRLRGERWPELLLEEGSTLDPRFRAENRCVASLEGELDDRGLDKSTVQADGDARAYVDRINRILTQQYEVTVSSSHFCEVTRAGFDKASALERLVSRLGFTRDTTIAFADMPNDLPMLRWAGRSVAVANAHTDGLNTVGEVTFSNDEDGVARYLEQMTSVSDRSVPTIPTER